MPVRIRGALAPFGPLHAHVRSATSHTISSRFTARCALPAMAAGVTDRLWDVADLVAAWEEEESGLGRAA
jgi:hypothetical protein